MGQSKKYQYKDEKYELNEIIKFIKEDSNLRYRLEEDNKMFINKLDKIIPGRDSGCCNELQCHTEGKILQSEVITKW